MKHSLQVAALALAFAGTLGAACTPAGPTITTSTTNAPAAPAASVPYGTNAAAGGTFEHDGVTLYYETYGEGEPLLVIHGNGASIGSLAAQIAHFSKSHRVIAMDSRDHGRSSDSAAPINYDVMTEDLAALLEHLKTGPVDVIGWSDGGIEALLLGARHPDKVKKLVAMAANLNPSLDAIYPETEQWVKDILASVPADARDTPANNRMLKVAGMMLKEPQIDPKLLGTITAPTLVLAGDHDLIRTEHTVEIFNALPNANLAIFPNATHMAPYDDPDLFNATVERFLKTPFTPRDRIADVMTSFEKLVVNQGK